MNSDIKGQNPPIQVSTFSSFPVDQLQTFNVQLAKNLKPNDLIISINSPVLGLLDKDIQWEKSTNTCIVSFIGPIVGLYTVTVDLSPAKNNQHNHHGKFQFHAKAYDLSKVFINGSSGKCLVNESYEFAVDASEAGEGQLEIAVNEGEIPNQVQVLDNGKCIVNFVPEVPVPHVVDIKFNGHNVNGCPFVVQVNERHRESSDQLNGTSKQNLINGMRPSNLRPTLAREELSIVDTKTYLEFENLNLDRRLDNEDLAILDPQNQPVSYRIVEFVPLSGYKIEFTPSMVGDYSIELGTKSVLRTKLPNEILDQFPLSLKAFDYNKVIVSDVTDGIIGHPLYFFIDASQAGSGNLEIKVSSPTKNPPNYPQTEDNAKIRVSFTPTEVAEHLIDVKFNGIPVPNNPFRVKVNQFPQARLPVTSQDKLKYAPINEEVTFYVDYIGTKENRNMPADQLTAQSCQVQVLKPDFTSTKLESIELIPANKMDKNPKFKISFKPTIIGPYKLFITVNNELLSASPIVCNVYNIAEVKVSFDSLGHVQAPTSQQMDGASQMQPIGKINEPVTFTVDASRAGEGTLSLAVLSGQARKSVQIEVKVSDKGHGFYNLTFVPTDFETHTIDMSFNDRLVPESPYVVYILDKDGRLSSPIDELQSNSNDTKTLERDTHDQITEDMENMNLKSAVNSKQQQKSSAKPNLSSSQSKNDELLQNIVVHGISLKRSLVNSTGAFIIETDRLSHARDFDVIITDPNNSFVEVQCYLQQDGNLLAEWTPRRVGPHKIAVLYKDQQVPNSPFLSEAFDPSSVILELPKSSSLKMGETIRVKVNRNEAGQADLDAAMTDSNGQEYPLQLESDDDIVLFSPPKAGIYNLSVTLGGYEVPKSPITFTVRDKIEPVKVSGAGLKCAEVNRVAQFSVDTSADGELKIRIENGSREIVPKVERQSDSYLIKYKSTEVGYASISLYWNGIHIQNSPYTVPINDLSKILLSSETSKQTNQLSLDYKPNIPKQIIVDTSACGPGDLKIEAYCRADATIKFAVPAVKLATGVHKLTFTCPPEQNQLPKGLNSRQFSTEATYLLKFYYNNLNVPETLASVELSPYKSELSNDERNNNNNGKANYIQKTHDIGCPVVALKGHGLVEAKCGEKAEFTIDGTEAGPGLPEVRLSCKNQDVRVRLEKINELLYSAVYEATASGTYSLNVLWGGKQVAGCPISIKVTGACDAGKVICTADSLKGAVLGEDIKTFIDTRKAGPGELTALCTGPQQVAFCELLDRGDGTFVLYIKPQESGKHMLTVQYGGQDIPKSPFVIKVSGKPDPTKVRVYGPGVEHGVLSLYQSRFVCNTKGAGAGQLTVRIRGPKGAFRMETQRESQRDRTILCKYDPTEPGDYRIEIKWSGRHVPGSPFSVMIFDTEEELSRFLTSQQLQQSQQQANKMAQQQVPFQSTMVEYGQYSNMKQPPFRMQ